MSLPRRLGMGRPCSARGPANLPVYAGLSDDMLRHSILAGQADISERRAEGVGFEPTSKVAPASGFQESYMRTAPFPIVPHRTHFPRSHPVRSSLRFPAVHSCSAPRVPILSPCACPRPLGQLRPGPPEIPPDQLVDDLRPVGTRRRGGGVQVRPVLVADADGAVLGARLVGHAPDCPRCTYRFQRGLLAVYVHPRIAWCTYTSKASRAKKRAAVMIPHHDGP